MTDHHNDRKESKQESKDSKTDFDWLCINTVRCLAADMVQKANSGHPGMPMGMAPIAHVMWNKIMNYSPRNHKWINRDRFVLSNGHGCALLYSMLHLTGYPLTLADLKSFRQLGSKTPGHPEANLTAGVEVSTGPLGQGISNAVGMAMAQTHLAAVYNKPDFPLFDHYTYVFCGDGCLQEGISSEASSLAGHLGLGRLIVLYDDNRITIDGDTKLSFTEDVLKRYEAYGWHTMTVERGNEDIAAIEAAVLEAKRVTDRPSMIAVKTIIGYGSQKQGHHEVHGTPLGANDIKSVKARFGLDPEKSFQLPERVTEHYGRNSDRGAALEGKWRDLFAAYEQKYPAEHKQIVRRFNHEYPENWQALLPRYQHTAKPDATRNQSGIVLNALAPSFVELIGGSADLTPSTKTELKCTSDYQKNTPQNRYIRFGVREHAMAAIGNGLAAYGGFVPFTATFLNFIEYCFPSVRLSALTDFQHLYIMTHDSIGLGEDGPTHQPVEAVSLCRATPNLLTLRPADGNETSGSYIAALEFKTGPSVLCLSRQNLPNLQGSSVEAVLHGGYVLRDVDNKSPDVVLIGTGSEVHVAVGAAEKLLESKIRARVVSMPCTELFDRQSTSYRRSVIPPGVLTVSVEALSVLGWERYAHFSIGMTTFGASAPLEAVMPHFGFSADKVAASVRQFVEQSRKELADMHLQALGPLPTHFEPTRAVSTHH